MRRYGLTVWSTVLGYSPWEDWSTIRAMVLQKDPTKPTRQCLSIDDQVEDTQCSTEFPDSAFTYATVKTRLSKAEQITVSTVLAHTLCHADSRNLDPPYYALLHHPWKDSSRRRSQDNPSGSKYIIIGVPSVPLNDGTKTHHFAINITF
jgi:hypothetical protein